MKPMMENLLNTLTDGLVSTCKRYSEQSKDCYIVMISEVEYPRELIEQELLALENDDK